MARVSASVHDYISQLASERKAKRDKVQLDIGFDGEVDASLADIITFVEAKWGLNQKLWPTQRAVLKCFFKIELDNTEKVIPVREYPNPEVIEYFTEKGFIKWLSDKKYCNIDPDNIHDARQLVLVMGRRSSKTFMSAVIICYTIYKLIKYGNPQARFSLPPGEKIVIANVAATKDQAGVLFNMVLNHISNSQFFRNYLDKALESKITIFTPWDLQQKNKRPSIIIKAHACSAKSIRGSGTIVAVLDELAHFDETGGPASDDKIYTAFTPSIITFGEAGKIISISSPLGESGKLHSMFKDGVEAGNKTYMCIQLPTWIANPTVEMKVLEEMESADPDNFGAEYGASFLASTSRSYIPKGEFIKAAVDVGRRSSLIKNNYYSYYMAIDVGFVKDGFATAVVHPEGKKIIVDYVNIFFAGQVPYEKTDKLDPDEMAAYVASVYKIFKPSAACVDQSASLGFDSLLSGLGANFEVIPFDRSRNNELYQRFRNRLYQDGDGGIRLPDEPYLLKELRNLRVSSASKYSLSVTAPSGLHDDLSDALVQACWLCERDFFDPKSKNRSAVSVSMSMSRGQATNPRSVHFKRQVSKIRNSLKR
jgi:hypothetical protein